MKFVFASIALLSASITHAATPISGWYTGLFGGYAYLPNNVHKTYGNITRSNASYSPGFDAGGSIGYKSTPMRYEGEITYLNADLKQFKVNHVGPTGVSGYSNAILAMANVYYDFPNRYNCLQPFLGGGIGYAWVHATLNSTGPLVASQFNASNTRFAYQGTAGIAYHFSENYSLTAGYRYVATTYAYNLGKLFQTQLASLGVVYRFDGNNYK